VGSEVTSGGGTGTVTGAGKAEGLPKQAELNQPIRR